MTMINLKPKKMECRSYVGPILKGPEPKYKVVRVYRNTGRKVILQRNLSLEEAKRLINAFPNCLNSMVCFYKQ